MSRSRKRGTSQPRKTAVPPRPRSSGEYASGQGDPSEGEVTIFLSYARADDRVYGMIRPFKDLLTHFIYAKSGRKVRAFLDQDDIEWGEIWLDKLETEILGAAVFIPLLSASYLDSDNCRMEFNRFQASATALGVKELILPVLLLDAPAIFNQNSTDDVVREAAARQWEIIEDAVLSDPGSAAWKVTMSKLADRFVSSYAAAESKLATLNESDLELTLTESDEGPDDDDAPGLAELMESIQNNVSTLTHDAETIAPAIGSLGDAASSSKPPAARVTPQQMQAWSRRAARAFEDPAIQLSTSGESMLNTTRALDVDMKRLRRLAVELLTVGPDVAIGYNDMLTQLSGIGEVAVQLEDLLTKFKPAEALSVPLRKALRPARRGLTRVTDSLHLIESWRPIEIANGAD